jgi:hypothetical protein
MRPTRNRETRARAFSANGRKHRKKGSRKQDREATLSDSADQLAKLWDKDAVRFPMGRPAEIGAAVIYADDKRWEMSAGGERTLCYDMEVQDSPGSLAL